MFLLTGSPLLPRDSAEGPSVFSWTPRYAEALETARRHDLVLAVYFRPVIGVEPLPLQHAPKMKNLGELVSGVRVGPAEVLELRERFAVSRFPALVILDAREAVLMRWEESIPPDVWSRVARTVRTLEERREEDEQEIEAARTLFDAGSADLAYQRLSPLLRSGSTALGVLRNAKELETRMVEAGEERIRIVLAAEGLVPDDQLRQRLRDLFAEPLPPRLKESLDRELRRIETTAIGGRTGG